MTYHSTELKRKYFYKVSIILYYLMRGRDLVFNFYHINLLQFLFLQKNKSFFRVGYDSLIYFTPLFHYFFCNVVFLDWVILLNSPLDGFVPLFELLEFDVHFEQPSLQKFLVKYFFLLIDTWKTGLEVFQLLIVND